MNCRDILGEDYSFFDIEESDTEMISLFEEFIDSRDCSINDEIYSVVYDMWVEYRDENEEVVK